MRQQLSRLKRILLCKGSQSRDTDNSNSTKAISPVDPGMSTSITGSDLSQTKFSDDGRPRDLWQVAYNKLDASDQRTLSAVQSIENSDNNDNSTDNQPRIVNVLDQVVRMTKEQYDEYQKGGLKIKQSQAEDVNLRDVAHRIINATLSFKDTVGAILGCDPTNGASSVWAIVSLGLMMAKNHNDLRNMLFDSSEFLADLLARCAYIERRFYHENDSETKSQVESTIVRVYRAILHYTVEVQTVQQSSIGRRMLGSVTAITNQPLSELKTLIEKEEQYLHQWIQIDQHLQHKREAESILSRIDEMCMSIQQLHCKFGLSKLFVAEGAPFDSYENQYQDECLPGTRTKICRQIEEWAVSPHGKCIYWLNGMAGTGKSTISQTMAKLFENKGLLGTSFFFKRGGGDCGNATRFFSTITAQLATRIRPLIPSINAAIEDDPGIAAKSLKHQFNKLLLQPLLNLNQAHQQTVVLVIDALDECDRENDVRVILELLPQMQKSTMIQFRILLTSRPELPIRLGFNKIDDNDRQDLVLQEIPKPVIEHDISLFLADRFSTIRKEHSLPPDWPGDDTIRAIVAMAVPLFIFAATVCRFVGDQKWRPDKRLANFLNNPAVTSASKMNRTYRPILEQLLTGQDQHESKQLAQEFQDIVGTIILLATPLSVQALANLINIPEDDISTRLDSFHSVLQIPSNQDQPIRILHLSFRDYLLDPDNKGGENQLSFWVDEKEKHRKITGQCLAVMRHRLKRNICNLPGDATKRTEIHTQVISQYLPPELQYSCQYWAHHLEESKDSATGMDDVLTFLQEHLLHWLEAMSIMGILSKTVGVICMLQAVIQDGKDSKISEFLHDAKRFILKNIQIADTAPLQLYCSGLVFAPAMTMIRRNFKRDLPSWIRMLPEVSDLWNAELQTLEGHSGSVNTVVFSPDSQIMASASGETIKLWDAATGALQQNLNSHSDLVKSVIFSHNNQLVISSSSDSTVKIWDAITGILKKTLYGHSDQVTTVVLSPDNQLMMSASSDKTVKLWDATTGGIKHTLKGHSDSVSTAVFSPDCQMVASASCDKTIKLWDAATGVLQKTLEGHSNWVRTVEFSPNKQLIASASQDKTVKIWDATTGAPKQTLRGHSGLGMVAFSPDGKLMASVLDRTVRLWDTATGTVKQTLEDHSNRVKAVVFSSNSHLLACVSDRTVNIWDTVTGVLKQTLEGHSSWVTAVAFSPDNQILASASNDKTIKLWDTAIGAPKKAHKGHSDPIKTVIFSPNGQLAASASGKTVKLWHSATGALKQTLEDHSGSGIVAFSPNSKLMASVPDKTINLWDTATGVLKQSLDSHSDYINTVVFSPDSQLMASAVDKTINLWDTATGALKQNLDSHSDYINTVAFSSSSLLIASASDDDTIKLWDAATGALKQTLYGHSDLVITVVFSSDNQLVASGSSDKTVKLWDTTTGIIKQTFYGHLFQVSTVALSSDNQLIAAASPDRTLKLWDVTTGVLQQTLHVNSEITSLTFSKQSPHLETNLGSLDIQPWYDDYVPTSPQMDVKILIEGQWVALQGRKALWLPPEYRPICSAVKDGTLVLACASGWISFLGLCA